MTLIAPEWDSGFADNGIHGEHAQRARMQSAVRYCKNRRVALDVGAHIGVWTKFLAGVFQTVHAFEPVRENMHCLEKNTAEMGNVVRWPHALGHARGAVSMIRHGGNSGCWRVSGGTDARMSTLDAHQFRDVDFIKIDTEGYEGYVLQGAAETLARCKPVVVIEDNGLGQRFYETEWVDPKSILRSHGYRQRARFNKDSVWTV